MLSITDKLDILVIEDHALDFALIEKMLLSSKINISNIYSTDMISKAKKILDAYDVSLVLLDLALNDSSGIDSFKKLKLDTQKIPVIILTGDLDSGLAFEALKEGAQDYLVKGEFNSAGLTKSIQYSIERKNAEESLINSKEMYRQMFYKNPFPTWVFDGGSLDIIEVNDAGIETYGFNRKEFLELSLNDIHFSEDLSALMDELAHIHYAERVVAKTWRHKKKNGEVLIAEVTYHQVSYFGELAMQAQINDVTEKVRLQKELKLKHHQLTAAVLNAQENERKLIGEELHNNINQILATVKVSLGFALDNAAMRTELISKSIDNTYTAIEEVRKLSKALIIPGSLKELGLLTSLEELAKDKLGSSKIKVRFQNTSFKQDNISERQKIAVFRIVQEQLSNIVKHADASTVTISLNLTENSIIILISDDGKGFDTSIQKRGVGINNIVGRAELFNGKVDIDSAPGTGYRLKVELKMKSLLAEKTISS